MPADAVAVTALLRSIVLLLNCSIALNFGPFVYRLEDTAFSRRGGGFDSLTGYLGRAGRGKAWLIRKLGELEIAGSNPAALIP